MFALVLNPMRGSFESRAVVAIAEEREALEGLLKKVLLPTPYSDVEGEKTWTKHFIRGTPFEWYNPPSDFYDPPTGIVDAGTRESWAEKARQDFDRWCASVSVRL